MKALKLSGPNGVKIARCCFGSALTDGMILIGVTNRYFAVRYIKKGNRNETVNLVPEITLPIDTLVFDPLVAMREKIQVICQKVNPMRGSRGVIRYAEGEIQTRFKLAGDNHEYEFRGREITLDIEAACRLDGVKVVEI